MKVKVTKDLKTCIIIISAIILLFIVSFILFAVKGQGKRRTFIFPSVDTGSYVVETRYLPAKPVQGNINLFIDELLLGSGVERTKLLFTPGTKVESCFLRKDILYLNLSDDLMQMGDGVLNIEDGVELLKKNIKSNFSKVKTIQIFVNGQFAFE